MNSELAFVEHDGHQVRLGCMLGRGHGHQEDLAVAVVHRGGEAAVGHPIRCR